MNSVEPRDLAVLYRIASLTAGEEDARSAERAVLAEIMAVLTADSGSISLLNPHTGYLEIVTQQGLPPDTGDFALKLGQGVTGWVTLHGRALFIPEVSLDARYIAARSSVRCEMAVPLVARGQTIGVINLDADRAHAFDEGDLVRLERFAAEASRTLNRIWQLERLQSESAQLETLVNLGHSLVARLEEGDLLSTLTRSGREVFGARLCTLHACDPAQTIFELQAWSSDDNFQESALRRDPFDADHSYLAAALRTSRVIEIQSLDRAGADGSVDLPNDRSLRSALAAPLFVDGVPAGVHPASASVFRRPKASPCRPRQFRRRRPAQCPAVHPRLPV
jgi:GAF domain-containing protein